MMNAERHAVLVDRGNGGWHDCYVNDEVSYARALEAILRTETSDGTVVRGLRVVAMEYHPTGVEILAELRRVDGQWTEAGR